jgi:hypothetical protein
MTTESMTPEQMLKHAMLLTLLDGVRPATPITADNVDKFFDDENIEDDIQDAKSEMRGGEVETGLPCPWSRHYESKSVAAKMPDGSWVGWTYWYGGGKHGEPEAIDWMDEAYFLDCAEEEKVVTVRTFTRKEAK